MSQGPPPPPGVRDADAFLRAHWQKRPLCVRGALPGFRSPLSPGELAGLACEEGVDSRIVLAPSGPRSWELRCGPFTEDDFRSLPDSGWTLLVQEVDRLVPEVGRLLESFRFVPNWRIDDVMVSYAADGGGVGPHVDNYDVFLLQGLGRRRWGIGRRPVEQERLLPGVELRVLASFEAEEEWVLEPGDLLYLPPRFAHHGVALGPCMTFSIGFRAPSLRDLAAGYLIERLDTIETDRFYEDPDLGATSDPGEISWDAIRRTATLLREGLVDERDLADWLGAFVTRPRREGSELPPERPWDAVRVAEELRSGGRLERSAVSRFAYVRGQGGTARLFVGGRLYRLPRELAFAAPLLCGKQRLDAKTLGPHLGDPAFVELLVAIGSRGFLVLGSDS